MTKSMPVYCCLVMLLVSSTSLIGKQYKFSACRQKNSGLYEPFNYSWWAAYVSLEASQSLTISGTSVSGSTKRHWLAVDKPRMSITAMIIIWPHRKVSLSDERETQIQSINIQFNQTRKCPLSFNGEEEGMCSVYENAIGNCRERNETSRSDHQACGI